MYSDNFGSMTDGQMSEYIAEHMGDYDGIYDHHCEICNKYITTTDDDIAETFEELYSLSWAIDEYIVCNECLRKYIKRALKNKYVPLNNISQINTLLKNKDINNEVIDVWCAMCDSYDTCQYQIEDGENYESEIELPNEFDGEITDEIIDNAIDDKIYHMVIDGFFYNWKYYGIGNYDTPNTIHICNKCLYSMLGLKEPEIYIIK